MKLLCRHILERGYLWSHGFSRFSLGFFRSLLILFLRGLEWTSRRRPTLRYKAHKTLHYTSTNPDRQTWWNTRGNLQWHWMPQVGAVMDPGLGNQVPVVQQTHDCPYLNETKHICLKLYWAILFKSSSSNHNGPKRKLDISGVPVPENIVIAVCQDPSWAG